MIYVQVHKRYGGFSLNAEIELHKGCVVIAGVSGSGKSTTLKMIAGLVKPDSGVIRIADQEVFSSSRAVNLSPDQRRIGLVPQNHLLFPHMNVFSNIAFGLRARRCAPAEVSRRVFEMLDLCGLREQRQMMPHELSGGQQQRVALARALVFQPAVLLMDEPFSALDVETGRRVRQLVHDILRAMSIPVLLVTHDPIDALSFGNMIYMMESGAIVQKGTYQELRLAPRSQFVGEFTGLNVFRGTAVHEGQDVLQIRTESGLLLEGVGGQEGPVLVLFSPNDVTIFKQQPSGSARNCLATRVRHVAVLPNGHCKLFLQGEVSLTAEISVASLHALQVEIGDEVYATVKATALQVVPAD